MANYNVEVDKSKDGEFFVRVASARNKKKLYHTENYKKHAYALKVANAIKDGRENFKVIDLVPPVRKKKA